MAVNSKIEWTEATWNPLTGCKKIKPGLQVLLCRTFVTAAPSYGPSKL
jgi:protein gp37